MPTTVGSSVTSPASSNFTCTLIMATSEPQPNGAHPEVSIVPLASDPKTVNGKLCSVKNRANVGLFCTWFELRVSIVLNDFDLPSERRMALLTIVLSESKPTDTGDGNNCGGNGDPVPSYRAHPASILACSTSARGNADNRRLRFRTGRTVSVNSRLAGLPE